MLAVIGLALDVVGATVLITGLFRRPIPGTFGEYVYHPLGAARDSAFAVTGFLLLVPGFVLQSLSYLGVSVCSSAEQNALAAVIALVGSILVAYVVFGVAFMVALPIQRRWVKKHWNLDVRLERQRRGLRWWHHVELP